MTEPDETPDRDASDSPPEAGGLRFRWGAATDVGRVREINQDSMLVRDGLFVVADGMGGHRGGEVASAVAVATMETVGDDPTTDDLVDAVHDANRAVLRRAARDAALMGMGTTLCAVARIGGVDATEPQLAVINVGDSRVYVLSEGDLIQVTDDHSLVGELLREGQITSDEAAVHPQRNVVTRALGIQDQLLVDYWELPARTGDRYLLSSDGLFDELTDHQIAAVLREIDDPDAAAAELVEQVDAHGARDNVTIVVVDVEAGGAAAALELPDAPSVDHRVAEPPDPGADVEVGASPGPGAAPRAEPEAAAIEPPRPRWRRFFGGALASIILLGVILGFVGRYARDNYYVTFEDRGTEPVESSQVVIFQGRPGGVLWFEPTVEERTPILGLDLTDALVLEVDQIPEFDTLDAARRYVVELTSRAVDATE